MAKIKTVVDSLDGINESLHDSYKLVEDKKSDNHGKYILAPEVVGGFEVMNPAKLMTTLNKERTDAAEMRTKMKAFDGLDADEARTALGKLKEFEGIDPEKEADRLAQKKFESLEKQLLSKQAKELESRDGKVANLEKALEKSMVKGEALSELAKHGGNPDLLLLNVTHSAKVKEVEGEYEVEILGKDGYARINGDGSKMGIGDLVAEMKESDRYGEAFKASDQSGGGTPPEQNVARRNNSGGTPGTWEEASETAEGMVAYIDQNKRSRG